MTFSTTARTLASSLILALLVAAAPARADDRADAVALLGKADTALKSFLNEPRWSALRNMLGGARAVAIFPELKRGGFIVAGEGGAGVFLIRHGAGWSDPLVIDLSTTSVGFQAGAEVSSGVLAIMADTGPKRLLDGAMNVGGTASVALADLGVGAAAQGAGSTGIDALMVTHGSGLFAGGALGATSTTVNQKRNFALYGEGTDLKAVAERPQGRLPEAAALRETLAGATAKAWRGD